MLQKRKKYLEWLAKYYQEQLKMFADDEPKTWDQPGIG